MDGIDEEAGLIQVQYEDGEGGAIEVADWRHVMVDHDAPMDESLIPPGDDDRP